MIKIAGAVAEEGSSLETVYKTAHDVLDNLATTSVGLTACAIPGQYSLILRNILLKYDTYIYIYVKTIYFELKKMI